MIKVNLISKKRKAYRGRNWTKVVSYALFGLLSAYFLGATLYVVISTLVINGNIAKVGSESKSISSSMLQNNDKLSRFVLTKLILTEIENVNKGRFKYKDYLDNVSSYLPSGNVLTAVDFATKGWLSVMVNSSDSLAFASMEKVILNEDNWKNGMYFSSVYVESVSLDKGGSYSTRLQFELKKTNGTK
jgi:hypothetical protein